LAAEREGEVNLLMARPYVATKSESSTRWLINPFAAYAAGFFLALGVYSLGYSDLYPPLQTPLRWFLLATCVVCCVLAIRLRGNRLALEFEPERLGAQTFVFLAIVAVFIAEVAWNRGVPLLVIAAGGDTSARDYGIPVVHVAFAGFCYFYAVYWFDLFLIGQGRIFLVFSLSAVSTSLLTFSRGAFIVTLIAIAGVYLQRRGFSRKLLFILVALFGAVLWGFGLLGDIRTHGASGESIILTVGDASDKFLHSNIPTEFFWPYLYTSSPLANLQLNVTDRVAPDSPELYVLLELLPDFISKRLVSEETTAAFSPLLITEQLTVCTMFGRSFVLLGWIGVCITFLYFLAVCSVCLRVLKNSKYFVATTGILCSLAFLGIFDNMLIVSGGILPVIVALALKFFERGPNLGRPLQLSTAK
jgi:hypothetical protein